MNWQHLEARNRAYMACLNDQDWPSLGRFVAVDARYNGETIGLDGYRAMLIGSYRDIPDLAFRVGLLVSDETPVAARLVFDCTPKGDFLRMSADEHGVQYAENVFYQFERDRIAEVWSAIDRSPSRCSSAAYDGASLPPPHGRSPSTQAVGVERRPVRLPRRGPFQPSQPL